MTKRKGLKIPGPLPTPISLIGEGPSTFERVRQDRDAPSLTATNLSKEDQEEFAEALVDPPLISPALARAFQRRRRRLKPD